MSSTRLTAKGDGSTAIRLTLPAGLTTGRIMMALDAVAVAVLWSMALLLPLWHQAPATASGPQLLLAIAAYPSCYFISLYALGLYRRDALMETRKSLSRMPLVAAVTALGGAVLTILLTWVFPQALGPQPALARTVLAALICFLLCGMVARVTFRLLRQVGIIRRRLLIVGAGRRAWDLVWILRAEGRSINYEVMFAHPSALGEVDPRLADGSAGKVVPASGYGMLETAQRFKADQIVVAPDDRRGMELMDLLACKTAGFPVRQYLTFLETETRRIDLKRMELGWLLYSDGFYFGVVDRALKRILDVAVSLLLLVPAMPLLVGAMVAIKLDDGGPIFYNQTRVTRGRTEFAIMKLRTMRPDAEAGGAVWAASKDRRITRIGGFLRRTRIDELPQLFNVLRGDMSFVGPRPERPGFVDMLTKEIPLYNERHLVKAGLTGWAQINYPYGASIDDARSKLSYDLFYVKNFSVLFDVMIILQTLRVVLWPGGGVR